jgi:hypothetical protein
MPPSQRDDGILLHPFPQLQFADRFEGTFSAGTR